jgi:hypothetical protein
MQGSSKSQLRASLVAVVVTLHNEIYVMRASCVRRCASTPVPCAVNTYIFLYIYLAQLVPSTATVYTHEAELSIFPLFCLNGVHGKPCNSGTRASCVGMAHNDDYSMTLISTNHRIMTTNESTNKISLSGPITSAQLHPSKNAFLLILSNSSAT